MNVGCDMEPVEIFIQYSIVNCLVTKCNDKNNIYLIYPNYFLYIKCISYDYYYWR